jgi:hypothetical protein
MECWALNALLQYSSTPSLQSFKRITVGMLAQEWADVRQPDQVEPLACRSVG